MSPNTAISLVLTKSEPVETERPQETDQSTSMENQRNADHSELVLSLSHSTRDQLITSLSQLSSVLQSSKPIPENAKQRTRKKLDETVRLLMDLSPFDPTLSTNDPDMFEETISGQLVVELSRAESSRMINHLVAIRDALLFDGLINGEAKRVLVSESKRIVHQLLDLPDREPSGESEEERNENNDEPLPKKQRVESEISGLKEELNKLKVATKSQEEQTVSLEVRIKELKSELKREELDWKAVAKRQEEKTASLKAKVVELKRKIEEVATNQAEASFKFELAGVSEFFQASDRDRYSNQFWCRGLQWSVFVRCTLKDDGSKQLDFYLECYNDDENSWSCKTDYKLILFNHLRETQNLVCQATSTFENKKFIWGFSRFISYLELIDEKNGYIKDDKVVLGVEMKAEPVVRK